MRTKQIKIDGEMREGVLNAGGPGFKIYSVSGLDGWVLVTGRKTTVFPEASPEYKTIGQYVMLKYQPPAERPAIEEAFRALVGKQAATSSYPALATALVR